MSVEIHDLRVAAIWAETNLALLGNAVPVGAPMAFLGRPFTYWPQFEKRVRGEPIPAGLDLPWYTSDQKLFWNRYLNKPSLANVTGKQAWKALVPFRAEVPLKARAPWLDGRLFLEAFLYPHGFAFVFTAAIQEQLALDQAVEKAFEVCKGGQYQVSRPDGSGMFSGPLEDLAHKAMETLRALMLGPDPQPGAGAIDPFTVATVVRGSGITAGMLVENGGSVQRALEALTTWYPDYAHATLPDLGSACVPLRQRSPQGSIVYGRRRGRAVWFPAAFLPDRRDKHLLACFHRNLVFASLQVESLGGLIAETAQWLEEGKTLPTAHRECAQNAASILYGLYVGSDATYRSCSLKEQMEQNHLVPLIDRVRAAFGWSALPQPTT